MINNIFKITIICLILVGAAGCESKSKSSSQPPTQEQQAPIDGNDQQQAQPLSQKAITAFKAFNEFQASTKYTPSNCVYKNYDAENSCLTNKNSLDADDQIKITGIAESNFEPDVLNYSNDKNYHHYYKVQSSSISGDSEDVILDLFTGNTIPYLDTNEEQYLKTPFSMYTKGEDLIYAFIAEEFDIDEGTKFPAEPIRIKHEAMVVFKPLYITQTKEEAERLNKGQSHLKIEFHVKNNDGTTSIYSSANITNSEYTNHHNLTDETGTVVGSFLMTYVYPIVGKPNIYHDTIKFYDTNKTLF